MKTRILITLIATALIAFAFKETSYNTKTPNTSEVPAVYKKIYGATSITSDGAYIYIKSKGVPDHTSPYYPASNNLHENFNGTTFEGSPFHQNPGTISEQNFTFRIPANPQMSSSHPATHLGPIGIALNGVAFFNQYAGNGQPLTREKQSFDKWWGHPAPTNEYHYHVEPLYLTTVKASKSALLGFLLDGFPVYGPEENEKTIVNTDLDAYHGHISKTADYPDGIYHYHITATDPYINGSGYYGSPGTFSR